MNKINPLFFCLKTLSHSLFDSFCLILRLAKMCASEQERNRCPRGCDERHAQELRQPYIDRRFADREDLVQLRNLMNNPLIFPLLRRGDLVLFHAIIICPGERNFPQQIAISPIGNISERALGFLFDFAARHIRLLPNPHPHHREEGEREDQ